MRFSLKNMFKILTVFLMLISITPVKAGEVAINKNKKISFRKTSAGANSGALLFLESFTQDGNDVNNFYYYNGEVHETPDANGEYEAFFDNPNDTLYLNNFNEGRINFAVSTESRNNMKIVLKGENSINAQGADNFGIVVNGSASTHGFEITTLESEEGSLTINYDFGNHTSSQSVITLASHQSSSVTGEFKLTNNAKLSINLYSAFSNNNVFAKVITAGNRVSVLDHSELMINVSGKLFPLHGIGFTSQAINKEMIINTTGKVAMTLDAKGSSGTPVEGPISVINASQVELRSQAPLSFDTAGRKISFNPDLFQNVKAIEKMSGVDFNMLGLYPKESFVNIDSLIIEGEKERTVLVGQGLSLWTTISPDNAFSKEVNWSSSDDSIATVSRSDEIGRGVVVGQSFGTVTIKGMSTYNSEVFDEITVHVVPKTYDITIENDGNGTATADVSKAAVGDEVELTPTPNAGYVFKEWISDDVEVIDNKFIMPEKAVTVKAIFEPIPYSYEVTFGANGEWTKGSGDTLKFVIDADDRSLLSVLINDIEIDPTNYEVSAGSTEVVLSSEYLESLDVGSYFIRFVFEEEEVQTQFSVLENKDTEPEDKDPVDPKPEDKDPVDPKPEDKDPVDPKPEVKDPVKPKPDDKESLPPTGQVISKEFTLFSVLIVMIGLVILFKKENN